MSFDAATVVIIVLFYNKLLKPAIKKKPISRNAVIPAKAGIQMGGREMDSGSRAGMTYHI
jgi:hypothetical protein